METMSMDKTFVLHKCFNTTESSLPKRNPKGDDKHYLDEISSEDKDMLYEVYKRDFLLFGYDRWVWMQDRIWT